MNTLTIESKRTCIAIGWGYCLQNLNCKLNLITNYTSIPSSAIFVILTHNSGNMKLYSSYPELIFIITCHLKVRVVTWPTQTGLFIVSCGRKREDSENEARLSKGRGRGRWCFYTSHQFAFTFKTLFTLDSLKRNPNLKLIRQTESTQKEFICIEKCFSLLLYFLPLKEAFNQQRQFRSFRAHHFGRRSIISGLLLKS